MEGGWREPCVKSCRPKDGVGLGGKELCAAEPRRAPPRLASVLMIKLLLLLLSGLKFLKIGKLLTTGGTMLLSVVVYAFVWGWRYAAGFVALLFVHEMGHYLAARQRGLAVGAPTFIPFVG